MRKVMIGCPCHDAKVHARWANSFGETIRIGVSLGIEVHPLFIPGNAMIPDARNEILASFIQSKFDDLVLIDADISWNPMDFFKLLNHQVDACGATYPYKRNELQFVMKTFNGEVPELQENGLMKIQGLGMGFFRITRKLAIELFESCEKYTTIDSQSKSSVFEFTITNGELSGEDITACFRIHDLGYDIWLDPTIILEHSGDRQHFGDPLEWLKAVKAENERVKNLEASDK